MIDNIKVDVFKIICWCEPTDSFIWSTSSAGAQPGHKALQPGHVPRLPPPLAPPLTVFVQVLVLDVLNLKLVNYGMSYLLMLEMYSLLIVSNLNFESIFLACVDLIGVVGIMCYTVL